MPPVPGGEDDPDLSVESDASKIPMEDGSSMGVRRKKERGRSREVASGRFSTPASWSSLQRDAGPSGLKTEGEMPSRSDEAEQSGLDGLQRELEKQVVQQLRLENQRLRMEVEKLQAGKKAEETASSWSAVTPEVTPAPPRSRSPMRKNYDEKEGLRFTPGGTQVPVGQPPDDEIPVPPQLPEWPAFLQAYQRCEDVGPCTRTMGSSMVGVPGRSRRSNLHDKEFGSGEDPRYLHDKEFGRGARSRYEEGLVQDRVEREMESMNLKAKWLENEIASSEFWRLGGEAVLADNGTWSIGINQSTAIKKVMVIGLAVVQNVMAIGHSFRIPW